MTTKQALENQIDRLLSAGYPGSESAEWKRANQEIDILEQALKKLEQPAHEINEQSMVWY